ncbi:FtsW/RodA/SpoVE family cell cycle protein [Fusibacter sp. JL298sf-3]
MQEFSSIKEYCKKICEQVRWKKARPLISKEIENHLYDQSNAYMSTGDDETSATKKAIMQMGDAVTIGQELDKAYKPKPQFFMITLTILFMLVGLSINYFIETSVDSSNTFSTLPYVLGFGVFILCYLSDFSILAKYPKTLYTAILVTSIIALIASTKANNAVVWIRILGIHFSPFYLSLIFPLAFALFAYSMRDKGKVGVLLSGIAYLPFAIILTVAPSFSGFIIYTMTALLVLCFTICRGWYGIPKKQGLMVVLMPAFIFSILLLARLLRSPYALNRINSLFNPEQDHWGSGYLYYVIRDILSQSVLFGKGHSLNVTERLPNISTDYSLVYLVHQFGFVIMVVLVLLLVIFSVFGIHKALKEKSLLGGVVSLTIILTFVIQAFFYLISNLGYGLFFSTSLPFISYGNVNLLINSALIGFMLSVFRTGDIFSDHTLVQKSSSRRPIFTYRDGKLIIDFKA